MWSEASGVKDNQRLLEIPDSPHDSFLTFLASLSQCWISMGRDYQVGAKDLYSQGPHYMSLYPG